MTARTRRTCPAVFLIVRDGLPRLPGRTTGAVSERAARLLPRRIPFAEYERKLIASNARTITRRFFITFYKRDGYLVYDIMVIIISISAHLNGRPQVVGAREPLRPGEHRERSLGSIAGVLTLNPGFMRFPCKRTAFREIYYLIAHLCALLSPGKTTIVSEELRLIDPPVRYSLCNAVEIRNAACAGEKSIAGRAPSASSVSWTGNYSAD